MSKDVTDGALIDVRELDLSMILTEIDESSLKKALDRLLASDTGACHGFTNKI